MKCATFLIAVAMLSCGCATKNRPKPKKLPIVTGVNIEFKGIKEGKCAIGDVFVNAKGGYTVICK